MFEKIKLFFLSIIAKIINNFNNYFNIKEIYSLQEKDKIIKTSYSLFYFRLLYLVYDINLYFLFNILYYFNPFKNELYVLIINYDNNLYKMFIDNKQNDKIYFILNYKKIFKLNDNIDMKILKCNCYLNNNNELIDINININNYFIENQYQTINNILLDLNINRIKTEYIKISQIIIYDILLDEIIKTYNIKELNCNNPITDIIQFE